MLKEHFLNQYFLKCKFIFFLLLSLVISKSLAVKRIFKPVEASKEIHGILHIAFAIVDSSYESIFVSPMNPNEAEICHIYSAMRVAGKLCLEMKLLSSTRHAQGSI